jgi:ribosome-binding ATPase YchF (GTP1/OBG family)
MYPKILKDVLKPCDPRTSLSYISEELYQELLKKLEEQQQKLELFDKCAEELHESEQRRFKLVEQIEQQQQEIEEQQKVINGLSDTNLKLFKEVTHWKKCTDNEQKIAGKLQKKVERYEKALFNTYVDGMTIDEILKASDKREKS